MSTLIFDTETTGLPIQIPNSRVHYPPSDYQKYDGSRIIEIAYRISDENKNLKFEYNTLVKFQDVDIKNSNIHGVTTEMVIEKGVDTTDMLNTLEKHITEFNVKRIVAHNIEFDMNVLQAECYRINKTSLIEKLNNLEMYCTMKLGKQFMLYYKYPKLIELYEFVFLHNAKPFKQHSAASDCEACEKCYNAMIK